MRTVHYNVTPPPLRRHASGRQDEKSLRVFIIHLLYTKTYYIMIIVIMNVLYAAVRGS